MTALFWILVFVMSAGALGLATRPLWSGRSAAPPTAAHDVAVYKRQLAELDRDVERGALSSAEAEGARREIARRLLAADAALEQESAYEPAPQAAARRALAFGAAPALVAALALYLAIGAPGAPDLPVASRDFAAERAAQLPTQALAQAEAALPEPAPLDERTTDLIARMNDALAARPQDPRGRILLAEAYMRLGRPAQAWPLYERAIALGGEDGDARLNAALGEAMVAAAGGRISREAEAAFAKAPQVALSQYMLGAADAQRGRQDDLRRAFTRWVTLYRGAPDSAFSPALLAQIRSVAADIGPQAVEIAAALPEPDLRPETAPEAPSAAPDAPGPDRDQIAAAAQMSPEDRAAMIEGMVSGLAERLAENPDDLPGWLRLIRAYGVMGRREDAAAALAGARSAFEADPEALAQLARLASEMALGAPDEPAQ